MDNSEKREIGLEPGFDSVNVEPGQVRWYIVIRNNLYAFMRYFFGFVN